MNLQGPLVSWVKEVSAQAAGVGRGAQWPVHSLCCKLVLAETGLRAHISKARGQPSAAAKAAHIYQLARLVSPVCGTQDEYEGERDGE